MRGKWSFESCSVTFRRFASRVAIVFAAVGMIAGVSNISLAQEANGLTSVLDALLTNNDRVLIMQSSVNAAEERLRGARSGWMPSIGMDVTGGHETRQTASGVEDKANDTASSFYKIDMVASQRVYDFGRTNAQVKQAELEIEQARAELEQVRQELLLDGLKAHFSFVKAATALQYARNAENNIQAKTGMEEALVKRGGGLPANALRAKKQLVEAQMHRVRLESNLMAAVYRYQSVFGVTPPESASRAQYTINAVAVPQNLDAAVERAFSNNLNIRFADISLKIAQQGVEGSKARLYPTVDAMGQYTRMSNADGIMHEREETLAQMEVKVPLFSGYRDLSAYNAAQHDMSSKRHQMRDVRRQVVEHVRAAWQQLVANKSGAQLLQNRAEIISELLHHVRREKLRGSRSEMDVVDVESDFIAAVSEAVDAETETILSILDLMAAAGDIRVENIPYLLQETNG